MPISTDIRRDFPQFDARLRQPLIYLANDVNTLVPRVVIERMEKFYSSEYSNVHRGIHYLSNLATDAFEGARDVVRMFIGANSVEEIIFTKSGEHAIELALFGKKAFGRDDRNGRSGVFSIDEDALTEPEAVASKAEKSGAALVIVPQSIHARHGTKFIRKLTKRLRTKNMLVLLDGRISPAASVIDVIACDIDYYVFDSRTCHGPGGVAVLYGRKSLLDQMPPLFGGGEMVADVGTDYVHYAAPPHRFEAGTPSIAEVVGFGEALRYLQLVGRSAIADYLSDIQPSAAELTVRLNSWLQLKNEKSSISMVPKPTDSRVLSILGANNAILSHGMSGLRATCALYNEHNELERLWIIVSKISE